MLNSYFYKFSSICGVLSGLLLMLGWTINIGRDSLLGASMVLAAYVLGIFAYFGIYSIQANKLSILGFIGFVLLVVGNALFTPWLFLDIARISQIVEADWLEVQEVGPTHIVGVIGGVGFVFGYFLLGFDTIRAKVFSKWPGVLLIIAGIMPLIYTWVPIGKLLPRIGGLALLLFGINLWIISSRNRSRQE